jgi:flagellar basal-body rod protein FlgF/flagellar basal-body rod protein FlgG
VDSGFYAACTGLRAQSQALEVAAHNLANLNTAGFRGEQTTFQSLLAVSHPTVPNVLNLAINDFGVLEGTHLDLTSGSLQPTANPLDVAIEGSGFFAIHTARGTRYTRNGSFRVSSTGQLVTTQGDLVLGEPPVKDEAKDIIGINVPPGVVSIASDGTLSVNGAITGTIRRVDFPPGTKLTPEGADLLAAPVGSAVPSPLSTLKQGALESSNVSSINSVVALLGIERGAEMMQRAMSLFDTEFSRIASNDLPKV